MKDAVIYLKDVRRELVRGKKDNTTDPNAVLDYFNEVKRERAECIQGVALAFAQEQQDEMNGRVKDMNKTIGKLKNKSVNTSEMEEVYEEAQENAEEMNEAIESGNGSEVIDTFKAIREEHLHIWARFHVAKLSAILDAVDEEAIAAGYESDVNGINALLAEVEGKVEPGTPYESGKFEEVKGSLKEAHQKLKDLIRKLRSG